MRPIKFRAFHKDLKIMREVFSINFDHNEVTVGYPDSETLRATLYEGEFELMQFTGLHDRNGKPIFEGDYLRINCRVNREDKFTGVVNFTNGGWHINYSDLHCFHVQNYDIEIIGNKWENPELLETK